MRKHWLVSLMIAAWLVGCPSSDSKDIDPAGVNAAGAGSGAGGDTAGQNDGVAGGSKPDDGAGGTTSSGGTGKGTGGTTGGGTGGKDPGTQPSGDGSLATLPDAFAVAICDALLDCVGPAKLSDLLQREPCVVRVAGELRATDFAYMDVAISAGRVLYDPTKLAECQDGIRALKCTVLSHSYPQACVDVLEGNVALDGECVSSAECMGTAFCSSSDTCPSKCTARFAAGTACKSDGQCDEDLLCLGGKCEKPAGDGDTCAGSSGKFCALGLNCVGSTDTASGKCATNASVQVGAIGDVCVPGGKLCKEGLSCVYDGKSAFVCEAAVDSGAACHLGLPGQCPSDEYCDATEVTAKSTCKKLPAAGKPCALAKLCAGGAACVTGGPAPTCRAIEDNGGACTSDATCRSGSCTAGKCAPPKACM